LYNGHRNRLGQEKSPYLLQHADNPVDWYPWGEEAFERATRENKPIFLSIGYSTCHWCHVMEHESFEDPAVAALMNATFISIKVDREERPDIDMVYMTVCQMLTGSGGWPLTIVLTPDKKPFFAGTYIPREARFGKTGMFDLVPQIKDVWSRRRDEVLNSAGQITSALQTAVTSPAGERLNESVMQTAYEQLAGSFDPEQGGFGQAPKFPTPHNLAFLLRYWKRTGNPHAIEMVETTLQAMRKGGIYDHIGFGFHRYSTDSKWRVPHFEKMLYDQAMLTIAYAEAFQATQKEEYSRTAREILDYVLRDMAAPEGGFYSAEDADSEGEEGKFYLWTTDETANVLSPEETELAVRVFNIRPEGNFDAEIIGTLNGRNILYQTESIKEMAANLGISSSTLAGKIEIIRGKLFDQRDKRVHPFKDDKILTDWNGLMIAALAKAARVLDEDKYARAAQRAADFILKTMRTVDGRLVHRFRGGEAALAATVDDYAFLIYGLLELYETVFQADYLKTALELNGDLVRHFWDAEGGGFYFSADESENLLVRQKDAYDGAIPSGNSIAMLNLLRLGRITGDVDLEKKAAQIGKAFYSSINQAPSAHGQLLIALDFALGTAYEIVIAGDRGRGETKKMLEILRRQFIPNKVVILRAEGRESDEMDRIAPWTRQHVMVNGRTAAYVCRNFSCGLPVTDADGLLKLIKDG
jgi:uncharacterized protein YyaL (SSP411 family)